MILVFPFSASAAALGWRELVFPPEQYTMMGDVNGDGFANAQDALHILQYAVGKRNAFENNSLSDLKNLVYPELVLTTPTDVTPTDQ